MSRKERGKQGEKRGSQEPQQVTRRQFLKEASIIAGGVVVASLALTSACGSPENTTTSGTTTPTTTTTTPTTATGTTTTTPTTTTPTTTTGTTTSLPPAEGFVYKTPLEQPPVMAIPGCTTFTATDRKYVIEHMWVKMVAENIVAIGITEKMVELMDLILSISLPEVGSTFQKGGIFGYADGGKFNIELPCPVSGIVLQRNIKLDIDVDRMVGDDPYVRGWFVTIQLTNPEEWGELLMPQEYTDLNAKVQNVRLLY